MEKKLPTKEQIKKYSAMAGAVLATGAVNAQIQYVDIDPDQTVNTGNSPFMLDLDGDMVVDMNFIVGFASGTYYGGLINYTGNYAVASGALNGVLLDSSSYAAMLSAGNVVDGAGNFGTGSQILGVVVNYTGAVSGSAQVGNFLGMTDGYMGVEFAIGGNTHYGWVRLDVAPDATSMTIKDYAYHTVADQGLNTGEDGVGLEDVAMEDKIHFKPMLNQIIVNVTPDLVGSNLTIVDLQGKTIATQNVAEINTTISYDGIDSGIYMVVVSSNDGSVSKKVYIR